MKIKDFIDLGRQGYYKWYAVEELPEFDCMKACKQSPYWHAEGNVWEHTKKVCEEAVKMVNDYRDEMTSDYVKEIFLAAALFHDIGKPLTTFTGKDGKIHSYGHEERGEKLARLILWDEDVKKRENVCALIKWHMDVLEILKHKNYLETILEISKEIFNFKLLILLKRCDLLGSVSEDPGRKNDFETLTALEKIYNCLAYSGALYKLPLYTQIPYYISPANCSVYMMIGLPGAGKTTCIEEIIRTKNITNYTIVSRDLIRIELGYCGENEKMSGTLEQENKVSEVFNERLADAIKKGGTIFLDNLNMRKKYRDGYKTLLKNYRVNWIYVYVQAETIEENISRRQGQVPEKVFKPMIEHFDWPAACEYDELHIKISNDYGKI